MTDEHMDARLRAAGEHWRAANDAPAGVDVAATVAASEPEIVAPAGPRRPRHWGLLASAAVVAAALTVGGTFALRGGNGTPNRPNAESAGLVGTVWELVGYNDEPDRRTSSDATLYIDRDGQLVADDTCGVVGGKAQVGDGELTVTDQVIRYRECIDSVGEVVFSNGGAKVLEGTATFEIDGDTMTISRAGTTMYFVAAPLDLPAPSLDVPTFVGAHWKLVRALPTGSTPVPITGDIPFFVSDDGKLTASDGCNVLTGTATGLFDVRFENVGGTEIGCDTEQVIRAVLDGTVKESVVGTTMTLQKDGAGELTYQWVPADRSATDPQALEGETWRLSSVAGQPAVSDAQVTINGTTYTANDGCREFTGHVSVEPGSIAFTGVPTDNPPCGGAGGGQASTIDSFLSSPPTLWWIRDGQLLISGGGSQAFSLVFASGSGAPPTVTNPADALIGTTWYLQKIAASLVSLPVPHVSVVFDRAGGFELGTSCGSEGGSAAFQTATAQFSNLHTINAHSCPYDPTSKYFGAVRAIFTGRASWSIEGNQLTIGTGDTTLTFGKAPPPQVNLDKLIGRKWLYDSVEHGNSEGTPEYVSEDVVPYLLFDGQGGFTGRDGCLELSGTVTVDAETLSFGDVTRDTSGCTDRVPVEFDDILTSDVTWSIASGFLHLTVGNTTVNLR